MINRQELKTRGKIAFKANYWKCVLGALIIGFVSGGMGSSAGRAGGNSASDGVNDLAESLTNGSVSMTAVMTFIGVFLTIVGVATIVGCALKIFIVNPLIVGGCRFFNENRKAPAEIGEFGYVFKNNYMNVVKIMFFKDLYTFLWSLLFVIPGIVKGYEYRMIPYLLSEDSALDKDEVFALTREMMTGFKWGTFVLDLSFIGWNILSIFTCGILSIFYVNPYIYATAAELYGFLKGDDNGDAIDVISEYDSFVQA